jgi:hypothetical protein
MFLFSLARSWADATAPDNTSVYAHHSPLLGFPQERYSALFGFLPWSDAYAYYDGASRLADTGKLDPWNERRPINAALLAVRLGITGFDLKLAVCLQALLLAVSTFLVGEALARYVGIWAGIGSTALILAYGRLFQGTTLSESLAVALGGLSVSLLVRGVRERSATVTAAGLGAMSLGLSSRAGAMFVVPCLLLALFLGKSVLEGVRWKGFAGALVATTLAFSWTPLLNRTYGTGAGLAAGNFADVACGLALGGTWTDAEKRYSKELAAVTSERERAAFLYGRTIELVVRDSRPLFRRLWENERLFFRDIGDWLQGLVLFESPFNLLARCVTVLVLFGIARYLIQVCRHGEARFWLAVWAGLLLSIPFIYFREAGWRVFAATWPLISSFLCTGLWTPRRRSTKETSPRRWDTPREASWALVVLLAAAALAGPWIVKRAAKRPDFRGCSVRDEGGALLLVKRPGLQPVVEVLEAGQPQSAGVPSLELKRYVRMVTESGMEDAKNLLASPPPPFLLFWGYDYLNHRTLQLIAPGGMVASRNDWLWLRIEPWMDSRYFRRVVEFGPWEPCQAVPGRH